MQRALQRTFRREQSSPRLPWSWSNRLGGSEERVTFHTILEGERHLHFLNRIPQASKGIQSLIPPIEPCAGGGGEGSAQVKADVLTPRGRLESAQMTRQELTIAKRAASCPFAGLAHTEPEKSSAQILLICERPDCHWGWLGTAEPASAEKQRQAKWFLVPLKKITRAGHGPISEVILHLKLLKS